MDILTLELFDVSISQGLMRVDEALRAHPGLRLRLLMGAGEEMLCHNVQRLLEKRGVPFKARRQGGVLQLDLQAPAGEARPAALAPSAVPAPLPAPALPVQTLSVPEAPRPVLLLRQAFAGGDAVMGRRLLLGVLQALEPPVPWLALAHEALALAEDPEGRRILMDLQARGVPVRLSADGALLQGLSPEPFDILPDRQWQQLLGRGGLTVI